MISSIVGNFNPLTISQPRKQCAVRRMSAKQLKRLIMMRARGLDAMLRIDIERFEL